MVDVDFPVVGVLRVRKNHLASIAVWGLLLPSSISAQANLDGAVEGVPRARDVANAILHWVEGYRSAKFGLQTSVEICREATRFQYEFCRLGVRAKAFGLGDKPVTLSAFSMLQRLVAEAEEMATAEIAIALLGVSSAGLERDMFDARLRQIRDLGHFAIMRMDALAVWNKVHEVAIRRPEIDKNGKVIEVDDESEVDGDGPYFMPSEKIMWQVAALRLLAMKNHKAFRSSIEKNLTHKDSRIRLAASEALLTLHRSESLLPVTLALSGEEHPMVVVALVQAVQRILDKRVHEVPASRIDLAIRTAISRLGQVDWRSDMAIVQLIRNHPIREAVPAMIALMRSSRGEMDPILKIVNGNASRFLGLEAHHTLRKLTGAIVPEDPELWQEFWDKEKDNVVMDRISPLSKTSTRARMTSSGSFYGIPVLGSDVVFVLDTSGSMKTEIRHVMQGPTTGPRAAKKMTIRGSRLQFACRQTMKAVQGMPKGAKFSIVTFSAKARAWNRTPVTAGHRARHTAATILGRLRAGGGTNVFDALLHILEGSQAGYGEMTVKKTDEVFVLSDGEPSVGQLINPTEILEAVREINNLRKIRINTVFAGNGEGLEFMKKLAGENGGIFVHQK